ncbi:SDR family NAD(P)-dependent oxidoreductase [Maribacter antarcticus]|uniref:SDR family NAD(P)-dependent oxidoreductase n=1 Tax=Maribacter antarcticus TaxID=505250 RepID=UPI0004794F36|nr:SDR family oxidoreductase [Maribacter antarcticus]
MTSIFDLTDKVIIVTGGYGHLGSGIVNSLLGFGAKVIVAGRTKEKYQEKFKDIKKANLFFEKFDISQSGEDFMSQFKEFKSKYGSIDVVFNNAHFARGSNQENMSDEDWSYTMEGVLASVQKSIKASIPIMREQKHGKIINIASMYGHISPNFKRLYEGDDCEKYTNPPHYGAAKAGVIQLTKYYAVLLGKENIYVNAISPGPFSKDQIQEDNPAFIKKLEQSNPLNRIGQPKDLAGISVLLSSEASNFITGQNFAVDGGWTIW